MPVYTGDDGFPPEVLDDFARAFAASTSGPPSTATWHRQTRRLLRRRTRARLAMARSVDGVAIWLAARGHGAIALRLWHVTGLLRAISRRR